MVCYNMNSLECLSPRISIVHCSWMVFKTATTFHTELMNKVFVCRLTLVCLCAVIHGKISFLCSFLFPQQRIFSASYFDGFWDGG